MATKAGPLDVVPITATDITSTIAGRLRELLAEGRFTPGEQLTESAVAAAFGVSRGPVREALKRLIEQGLLTWERNRGVFVPELSREDCEDVYLIRGAIERAALTEIVHRSDPEVVAQLRTTLQNYRAALAEQRWEEADELDLAFHRDLVHASGSRRLINAFDTIAVETRMCLRSLSSSHPRHPDMDRWHSDILDAVERGDLGAAHDALEFHNSTVLTDLGNDIPTS